MVPFREADAARLRYLDRDECRRLVNASPEPLRTIVRGALYTGARKTRPPRSPGHRRTLPKIPGCGPAEDLGLDCCDWLEDTACTRHHLEMPSMQCNQRGAMPDGNDRRVRQNLDQHSVDFGFELFVKGRRRLITICLMKSLSDSC